MRKSILILCALCVSVVAFGQAIEVLSDGKIALNGQVSVGSEVKVGYFDLPSSYGPAYSKLYINTNGKDMNSNTKYGIYSIVNYNGGSSTGDCIGLYGSARCQSNSNPMSIRYIGVVGYAYGGSGNKANIGVAGLAGTTNNSVGIYGGVSSLPSTFSFSAVHAGYFAGTVVVTNSVTATAFNIGSDERLKRNIEQVDKGSVTEKLYSLNPIKYYLKQIETESDSINTNGKKVSFTTKRYDENSQEFQKMHYGLVAQELQQVFPELVYDGGEGYLSVNYVELIPLLLQAFQTQQATIQQQQIEIDKLKNNNTPIAQSNALAKAPQQEILNETATLFQNTPNPFNETTEIAFYLPQSVTNAMLCVYDMNGKQLSQNVINERGNSKFIVNGNSYGAGMYLYSLIADSQVVDTKRMILTK